MPLFASPDVEKLKVRRDLKRLTKALSYHASHHRPKDVELACAAARALAELRDVDGLIKGLDSPHEAVKVAAADALGEVGDERAIPGLTKIALTYLAGTWSRSEFGPRKFTGSVRSDAAVGSAAARALQKIGPKAVAPLVEALAVAYDPAAARGVYSDAIAEIKQRFFKGDPRLRLVRHAAAALGEIEWQPAADALERLEVELERVVQTTMPAAGGIGRWASELLAGAENPVLGDLLSTRDQVTLALELIYGWHRRDERPRDYVPGELASRQPSRPERLSSRERQLEAQAAFRRFMASTEPSADDAAHVLALLYDQSPHEEEGGGFLKDEEAAESVRAVGEHLHQHGGHELMLEAHSLFADLRPATGLAHNLEIVWDGIGTWQG